MAVGALAVDVADKHIPGPWPGWSSGWQRRFGETRRMWRWTRVAESRMGPLEPSTDPVRGARACRSPCVRTPEGATNQISSAQGSCETVSCAVGSAFLTDLARCWVLSSPKHPTARYYRDTRPADRRQFSGARQTWAGFVACRKDNGLGRSQCRLPGRWLSPAVPARI